MTTSIDFDRLLTSALQVGPEAVPPALVDSALTNSRRLPQRRPMIRALDRLAWPTDPAGPGAAAMALSPAAAKALLLALLVLALVALGLVGAGALRRDSTPKPSGTAHFIQPFEYQIPPGSLIRSSTEQGSLVAWVEGPDTAHPGPNDVLAPGMQPSPTSVHGIIVGSGEEAWSHSNTGRFMLRTAPADFLADLRDIADVPMGAIAETTLDGRPALTTELPGTGGTDIHVNGHMQGLGSSSTYALVKFPARLTVAEIDGTTVFILIWARTRADLQSWTPEADAFVRSIHFLPVGQP